MSELNELNELRKLGKLDGLSGQDERMIVELADIYNSPRFRELMEVIMELNAENHQKEVDALDESKSESKRAGWDEQDDLDEYLDELEVDEQPDCITLSDSLKDPEVEILTFSDGQEVFLLRCDGSSGDQALEKAMAKECQSLFKMFKRKQHDYGHANISEGGLIGVMWRANDKMARWKNLVRRALKDGWDGTSFARQGNVRPAVTSESLMDTLQDIADYGLIARLILNGSWPEWPFRSN